MLKDLAAELADGVLSWLQCVRSPGLALLASLLLVLWITRRYTRYRSLKAFPGPFWAGWTRLWLLNTLASDRSASIWLSTSKKFGPLARIGPNHLLLSDPVAIRKILAVRSRYERGPFYECLKIDPFITNVITERDRKKHQDLRHKTIGGYAGTDIPDLEAIFDERIQEWIGYISSNGLSKPSSTYKFDMARSVQYLTIDIITHLSFGRPFGFVKNHADVHQLIWTLESHLPIVEKMTVLVELSRLVPWIASTPLLHRILPQPTDRNGLGKLTGISRDFVSERYGLRCEKKQDMLGSFLRHGISRKQAETEITVTLFAGSDTTATALRSTLLFILTNPLVYNRLIAEIDKASRDGELSSPARNSECLGLPYLQACIKEGLRIFPPITMLRERVVPPGGDTICGQYVPAGTNIGFSMGASLRDACFEPDPEVFRPERWLITDQQLLTQMELGYELVFGYGATKCMGMPLALMTMNKGLVELLRHFTLTVIDPTKPWVSRCHGVFFQEQFNFRILDRSKDNLASL